MGQPETLRLMTLAPLLTGATGLVLLAIILWDAFETILVPRRIGRRVRFTRYFYLLTWRLWSSLAGAIRKSSRRESLLGFYGPLSLLMLLVCWAAGLVLAFAWLQSAALGAARLPSEHFGTLLYMSGETFFTLGFGDVTPGSGFGRALSVLEAGMGFGFLGTVVGYLPTLYTAFSQREIEISLLDARAGSPPTAGEFLIRHFSGGSPAASDAAMRDWERWSAQLLETHISYPLLAYYRSQHGNQSWLSALTAILDSSALLLAAPDAANKSQAKLTFAMARHALVDIMQSFVPRYTESMLDRLPPADLKRLCERLEQSSLRLTPSPQLEQRLTMLRRMYEPYAQALAAYLLFELPPWLHPAPRRDNWRGGPWDKWLGTAEHVDAHDDEHF